MATTYDYGRKVKDYTRRYEVIDHGQYIAVQQVGSAYAPFIAYIRDDGDVYSISTLYDDAGADAALFKALMEAQDLVISRAPTSPQR